MRWKTKVLASWKVPTAMAAPETAGILVALWDQLTSREDQKVDNNAAGNTKAYFAQYELIPTPGFSKNMYYFLDNDDEKNSSHGQSVARRQYGTNS